MSWTQARARRAAWSRNHPGEPVPDHLVTEVKATRLEEYVASVVASAPPLTAEQRDRIAGLLNPRPATVVVA